MRHKMAVLAVRIPCKNYKILRYFLVFKGFSVFWGSCGAGAGAEKEKVGRAAVGAKPGAVLIRSGGAWLYNFFQKENR